MSIYYDSSEWFEQVILTQNVSEGELGSNVFKAYPYPGITGYGIFFQ